MNTRKIADAMSSALGAKVITPDEFNESDLQEYDLIGFGAGIDSGMHYKPMLDLADSLGNVVNRKSFIFSTSAVQGERKVKKDHSLLRSKLESKGFLVLDEFSCKGFNTNLFLKYFGGMNKGRPDEKDLSNAVSFAANLLRKVEGIE